MSSKLKDKIALITGGTEGIGLATAKLFAKEGAYVFITGRRQKELDEAVRALGSNVYGVQGDIAKLDDLNRLYETISKVKGRLDIVFANAGVGEFVPFGAVTEEHFDKLFNINVRGTLFTVQKALPLLKDGGSIILNGSVASVKGTAAFGVYAASKAAIRSLVRTWTTDLKDRHIRSNVVSPGPINTPLSNRLSPDVIARIVSTIPMGRMGEPDEVAKAALFLASDDSSFVTGIELFVDIPQIISPGRDQFLATRRGENQQNIFQSHGRRFLERGRTWEEPSHLSVGTPHRHSRRHVPHSRFRRAAAP
jgi:NAD(P)-dependent dehydrogenase (short-subunit alcohol dehydrogenase family)